MLINLTPHAIVLALPGGERRTVAPSGVVARVATIPGKPLGSIVGVPFYGPPTMGPIQGLPDYREVEDVFTLPDGRVIKRGPEGPFFIVSAIVAEAARREAARLEGNISEWAHRRVLFSSLVSPGTGPTDEPIRSTTGQIEAVSRLILAVV